jgi:hypothetical protein
MADWRQDDRELLARTLMAEAGNQGPTGMLAAGNVIFNRAQTKGYGEGIRGVIMKPGQFSPLNSVTGYAGGEQGVDMDALRPSDTAYTVADALLSGAAGDITGGATHFYNPDISNPGWAEGKETTRIGEHLFLRADAGRSSDLPSETLMGQGTFDPRSLIRPQARPEQAEKTLDDQAGNNSYLDSLSEALPYLEAAQLTGAPQARFDPPGVRRPQRRSGDDALKRLGIASLVQ